MKKFLLWFAAIFALTIVALSFDKSEDPQDKRKREITAQFSPVTGENVKLTEFIKTSLNEPESYSNLKTTYWDVDTAVLVNQEFTFKNEYGGRSRGFIKALVKNDGQIKVVEFR
jgi:hypothetical protein